MLTKEQIEKLRFELLEGVDYGLLTVEQVNALCDMALAHAEQQKQPDGDSAGGSDPKS